MDELILSSFLDVMILGTIIGRESLPKELEVKPLQLSIEKRILEKIRHEDYEVMRFYYENAAAEVSADIRAGFADTLMLLAENVDGDLSQIKLKSEGIRAILIMKGYDPKTARNISTVFRTGYYLTYNGARYNNTRRSEMVWGYRYITAGDELVRENHALQQGVTLPKGDAYWSVWVPPNGYNCRCTIDILYEEAEIVEPPVGILPDPGFRTNLFSDYGGF